MYVTIVGQSFKKYIHTKYYKGMYMKLEFTIKLFLNMT